MALVVWNEEKYGMSYEEFVQGIETTNKNTTWLYEMWNELREVSGQVDRGLPDRDRRGRGVRTPTDFCFEEEIDSSRRINYQVRYAKGHYRDTQMSCCIDRIGAHITNSYAIERA